MLSSYSNWLRHCKSCNLKNEWINTNWFQLGKILLIAYAIIWRMRDEKFFFWSCNEVFFCELFHAHWGMRFVELNRKQRKASSLKPFNFHGTNTLNFTCRIKKFSELFSSYSRFTIKSEIVRAMTMLSAFLLQVNCLKQNVLHVKFQSWIQNIALKKYAMTFIIIFHTKFSCSHFHIFHSLHKT